MCKPEEWNAPVSYLTPGGWEQVPSRTLHNLSAGISSLGKKKATWQMCACINLSDYKV